MERKTHFERVVGGTDEEKEAAFKDLQDTFEERDLSLSEYEIEKTEKGKEIIKRVETIVDEMVQAWGGNPKPLPIEKIHVVEPDTIGKTSSGRGFKGVHHSLSSNIGVEKKESALDFASTLAHEFFHLKSYKSAHINPSSKEVDIYRSGLSMMDRKGSMIPGEEKQYFGLLEEAIVAECTRRFFQKISQEPPFREEAEAIDVIRNWIINYYRRAGMSEENIRLLDDELKTIANPIEQVEEVRTYSEDEKNREAYAAGMVERLHKKGDVDSTERWYERKKMYDMLDNLVVKSNGKFKNRDEVFNEFAKANFSGNYLSLARVVEDILGKGSFRKLANDFAGEKEEDF